MSAVPWKLLIVLDIPNPCSTYLDTSISYTQCHLWKSSPVDLVTVETCYQSSDKSVWIIWHSMSQSCLKHVEGCMEFADPFPRSHRRAEHHCPLLNDTADTPARTFQIQRGEQWRSMVALLPPFWKKSHPGFPLLTIASALTKMTFPCIFQQKLIF